MDSKQRNQEWASRIAAFKSSGQTMSDWCAAHELTIHQLKYWLKKQKNPVPNAAPVASTNWIPVAVTGVATETKNAPPLVVRVGQASIEIGPGFHPDLLRQVVLALAASC